MATLDKTEKVKELGRSCPICENLNGRILHSQEIAAPDEFNISPKFDIAECTRCGMIFADTRIAQEALDDLYRDHSKYADTSIFVLPDDENKNSSAKSESGSDEFPEAPWDLARLKQTAQYIAAVVPDKNARILDAGCATGALLGFLADQGFANLTGLDPSPAATATAAKRAVGITVVTGSFLNPPVDFGPFDLIILSHVLEHITDVGGAVSALRDLLAPGGSIYIEVPDAARYVDYLVAPFHDFNIEHINHFSLSMLNRLLADQEFEIKENKSTTVYCSPNNEYPVIFGIWKTASGKSVKKLTAGDEALAKGVRHYIIKSRELLNQIDARLRDEILLENPVMIWGAGQLSMKLIRNTVLAEANIVGIIDSSPQKQGLHFGGVAVISPEMTIAQTSPIVIGSIHHSAAIGKAATKILGEDRQLIYL